MSDPQRQDPAERPDPSALLIDAVSQRQSDLAQRLAQQWVHRRGWASLEHFVKGPLLRRCGPEARDWLRQRLGIDSSAAVLRDALAEAMAPLRSVTQPIATPPAPAAAPTAALAEDPWCLPGANADGMTALTPRTPAEPTRPAPVPEGLAGLRAWLHSDAA